jgi:hypothetical protein
MSDADDAEYGLFARIRPIAGWVLFVVMAFEGANLLLQHF